MVRPALVFSLVACSSVLVARSAAQATLPLPLDHATRGTGRAERVLYPRQAEIEDLRGHRQVRLQGLELTPGHTVELDLRRIDLARLGFGLRVDDAPWPDWESQLALSVWRGGVVGDPGSDVVLSFSRYGSRGWLQTRGTTHHLIAEPDRGGDWRSSTSRLRTESELRAGGRGLRDFCRYDEVQDIPSVSWPPAPGFTSTPSQDTLLVEIAVETDYQLFQVFGDVNAEAAYVAALLAAISDLYDEQIDVVLGFPYVQFYTNANDPWNTPDNGTSATQMLGEFRTRWTGSIPAGADLGHFLSGADLGGGLAFLSSLCNQGFGFAVSGNVDGIVQFPLQQQSGNWDFYEVSHEIAHNFGAIHTHEYCPTPLDSCAPNGLRGPCQTTTACSASTLMSYCHLCTGGTSNLALEFHPANRYRMRNGAEAAACADLLCEAPQVLCSPKLNSNFCAPTIAFTGKPSTASPDPFHLVGNDVLPNEPGLLIYGTAGAAGLPFHNGVLCVKLPFQRLLPPQDSGSSGTGFCPGELRTNFNARIQSGADPRLSSGARVVAQWVYRDPGIDAFHDGLTDGLAFHICP